MADGEIRVKLGADTERRLRAVADASGRSVNDYLRDLIAEDLALDWREDEEIAAASDRSGGWRTADDAVSYFRTELHRHVKKAG
ncbi:MAG: hypothetical protein JNL41_22405 [Phenylobacterium sp.]|uniref:hypothetical protein n=1 Tax=Phenylobacterium sp. TaxID=1871053 RepID=UPI001A5BD1B8|nr:hypothetical protein [Phenylobacterium sp.]MBL8557042.1 hypothetical protein [Phenylobacterium sp.]